MKIPSEIIMLILSILCVVCVVGELVIYFVRLPKDKRINAVREWLMYAVVEAEKIYKGGTGQLKLHYVYNLAIEKFPWIASFITFATFSAWVDDALVWMRAQLESNQNVKDYVEGSDDGVQ